MFENVESRVRVCSQELVKRDVIVWPTTRDDKTHHNRDQISSHRALVFFELVA